MINRKELRTRLTIIRKYRELMRLRTKLHLSEDEVRTLLSYMFELTAKGFEHYIGKYLQDDLKFDTVQVTGGIEDKGVDIRANNKGHVYAIQCKKYGASHLKAGEVLTFIENTQELQARRGDKLSLILITTSRVNHQARTIAKQHNVHIKDYRDILKLNRQFPLINFIKEHRLETDIVEPREVEEMVDMYYLRKGIKWIWLADFLYTRIRKFSLGIDYENIEKMTKNEKTNDYEFLQQ